MAEIWKGAPVAAAITEDLRGRCRALREKGVEPTLAILRVGEKPGDLTYESAALRRCETVGIRARRFVLPADCGRETLLDAIRQINADETIHGCLMLRPLPDRAMEDAACALLAPEKDLDGMTAGALASVFAGKGPGYPPCTAQAVMELLDYYGVDLAGKRAVVVGRSLVIGKPVAMMLQAKNATVTMCHTKTVDLAGECGRAQVLIAAAGKAGVIGKDHVAPEQVVIDVGINVDADGKLCGDVAFQEAEPIVGAITPVPGGIGAVTTAVLCKHLILAAEQAEGER